MRKSSSKVGDARAGKRGGCQRSFAVFKSVLGSRQLETFFLARVGLKRKVDTYQAIKRLRSIVNPASSNPPRRRTISSRPFM
jgi:hypothetical protein